MKSISFLATNIQTLFMFSLQYSQIQAPVSNSAALCAWCLCNDRDENISKNLVPFILIITGAKRCTLNIYKEEEKKKNYENKILLILKKGTT